MPEYDVVVAPGGLTRSAANTVEALRDAFPSPMPVVCILGNEEFRGQDQQAGDQGRPPLGAPPRGHAA